MKNIQQKRIAIVGGGPGGLTLARLLQLKGADVKVYERDFDKNVRVQGATLDLHEESGLKALEAAGLMDAFMSNYRPGADHTRITNHKAHILLDDEAKEPGELGRPEIDRGPLRKMLIDSLREDTIVWDSHFIAMSKEGDAWKLEFKNGTSAVADLVIAADGANSKIRPLITPLKPFYAGITVVEGGVINGAVEAPNINKLLNGGKIFAFGDEKSLIVSSKGDGSLAFYVGFKQEENWFRDNGIDFTNKEEVVAWFKQTFTNWDKIWFELFENAYSFTIRPQYCMPLDQTSVAHSNLTMLGDAAHLMPPYAGEGVNMAMLDALELSICLTDDLFNELSVAIAHYEKHMNIRFAEIGQITLEQTEMLHSPQAIANMMQVMGK
ncbi:NAD(P)/FAD-dependent oxidoreductase [Pedobacter nototheniae]|uniref:FAD-dependent oxidoreductase n=1 Tax=Pedobacter nototheniae TaxID=2488994 RepID=UPI00292D52F6|nr:NAD(P)/FAD-dependent oxidoreductase [Pedobacter nototheniae]